MGCIYLAVQRKNGKGYVDKTSKTLQHRKRNHKSCAAMGEKSYFYSAIRKYGWDVFEWTILFESDDEAALFCVEIDMIAKHRTFGRSGYNLTHGGEGASGCKHTAEMREKVSASLQGNKRGMGRLGHKHSAEARAKMSASHKGKKFTVEHRTKLSEALQDNKRCLGYKHTAETRAKISASKKGRKLPERTKEHRAKLSAAQKAYAANNKITAEARAKISIATKNRNHVR